MRVCIVGGAMKRIQRDLSRHTANCVVWCGYTGLDVRSLDGLFSLASMPSNWAPITIICLKYGAQQADHCFTLYIILHYTHTTQILHSYYTLFG